MDAGQGKGRWSSTSTSDRVRVNIPGEFDSCTLAAWIRLDALQERYQGLLLTDGFEVGHPHWQIAPRGELRLGVRGPSLGSKRATADYDAAGVFGPGQIGVWSFLAVVYDRQAGKVSHYVNGQLVSSEALQIGSAEIGNWGRGLSKKPAPVRNFIGLMDELTLCKVALTSSEIAAMHGEYHP